MTNNVSSKNQFIEKLHTLIKEGDEVDRSYAIRGLADLNDPNSKELLFKCLHDEDLDVSIDAVNALGVIGNGLDDESIAEKLIESFLNDPEGEIKVACLESLSKINAKQAIPHFLKIAEHSPEDMQFNSGDWDLWWDMQLQSIRGLAELKVTEAIPVLQRLIESDDYLDIENEIFNAIVKIGGKESDEYLLSLLSDGSPRIKRRVAKALGASQSKSTLKLLARSLKDKDPDVREATLLALQERGVVQYLPAILLMFRDSNANVRKTAVKVAQALSKRATTEDAEAAALIEKLKPVLQDPDSIVRTAALKTLLSIGWIATEAEAEFLTHHLETSTGDYFTAICQLISQQKIAGGYASLIYLLRHNELDTEEKIHALMTLGHSGKWNTAIESTIGALIFDEQAVVRLAALEALAELDKDYPQGSDFEGRLPIEMVSEALEGQLSPPATSKIIPIVPVEELEQKFNQADNADAETPSTNETVANETNSDNGRDKLDTSFVDDALKQISQSIADGEKPHPMSTLDSIAITHVEDELKREAAEGNTNTEKEVEEDLSDFIALTEENKKISKWLFNKESIDVGIDIKRLSARILGNVASSNALGLLQRTFDSNDPELKREAALSIAHLLEDKKITVSLQDPLITMIRESLNEELNAAERDLRIAVARALAELGTTEDIPNLIEKLFDEDTAMRKQALSSLSKIANRSDGEGINFVALTELMLDQLNNNDVGVHRAAIEAVIPFFGSKLNGSTEALKQTAISRLIQAGLSGSHGQVREMSWGMKALDKELSSTLLLEKINEVSNSVERRYMVEMLGELYRENA